MFKGRLVKQGVGKLKGNCFWREAPERVIESDRRAGKWGLEGEANNDIKQPAILARVIPRFLEKLRATPVAEYDAKEDVRRLLRQIDDSEAGRHPFQVPLPADEIARLCDALRQHLR